MLFVALNYWQVGREEELAAEPEQHPRPRSASSTRRAARSSPPTAWWSPSRCRRPAAATSSTSGTYPTGDLFADITGYYTFGLGSTQLEQHAERRAHRRHVHAAGARPRRHLQRHRRPVRRRCALTLRDDLQHGRQVPARRRARARSWCSSSRPAAIKAMWSYPSYDPNLVADLDFDDAYAYVTELQADPTRPAARQRLPAALHAGLDVQGAHHRRRPRRRRRVARHACSRRSASSCRRRPTTRSRTTTAPSAAAT